jgi:hypothetical protein
MDAQINNEFVSVVTKSGEVILSQYFDHARVETGHIITKASDLSKLSISAALPIPETGKLEKNQIYLINGQVFCAKEEVVITDEREIDMTKCVQLASEMKVEPVKAVDEKVIEEITP